jgi:hypothetical protein
MTKSHSPNSQSSLASLAIASALAGNPPVLPLYVTSRNCELVVGLTARRTRELAEEYGVPIIRPEGSNKWLISAVALIEALERAGKLQAPEAPSVPEPGSADELEAMRAKLGMRRAGGAR